MGKCTSKERNIDLKKLGEKTKTSSTQSLIDISSKIIISQFTSDYEEDYKILKFLGEGSYAECYAVQNRLTGINRAMKILHRKKSLKSNGIPDETIINEIKILCKTDHPNILKLLSVYYNELYINIITELCSEGELYNEIDKNGIFNEKKASYVIYQILSAINYCHKMNIIHRDLKPENIFIVKREDYDNDLLFIKIGDFGTAKWFEENKIERNVVGSCYYIAPEVLEKKYNEKCDLWSIGVIMYILLSGKPPFNGVNDEEIYKKILNGSYDLKNEPWDKISNEAKDLIYKLLLRDTEKRINAEDALKHKWFIVNQSKELFNKIENKVIIEKLINNLLNYKNYSIIQECALAYLVHNFNQTRNVINACKLFSLIDTDNDGKINERDLLKGLKKIFDDKDLEKKCHIIFENIDMNHNIYVEYEEFVRGAVDKEKFLSELTLKFAFRFFDKDGNAEIDYREIEEIFKDNIADVKKVHENIKKIIDEVDSNNDGKISFNEFCIAMKKMIQP